MDHSTLLAFPLARVFGYLAAPAQLAGWLPEVASVQAGAVVPLCIGTAFPLRLRRDGQEVPGTGELIAYEPPWYAAYRLLAGPGTYVLRITCTASESGTRVRVQQAGGTPPLAVDLARLPQLLAAAGPGTSNPDTTSSSDTTSTDTTSSAASAGPAHISLTDGERS